MENKLGTTILKTQEKWREKHPGVDNWKVYQKIRLLETHNIRPASPNGNFIEGGKIKVLDEYTTEKNGKITLHSDIKSFSTNCSATSIKDWLGY